MRKVFTDRRPEGAKRPRARSVNTLRPGSSVVTSLSPPKCAENSKFEFACFYGSSCRATMAKRNPPKGSSSSQAKKRFDFDIKDEDFEEYTRGYVPQNTTEDTQKCIRLFQEWRCQRNLHFPEDEIPEDILQTKDKRRLCHWLCKFSTEVRKKDGSPFPPKSIHHYLLGIQRHIRVQTREDLNFFSEKEFLELRNLLDALFRKLHASGVGTTVKKTPVLSQSDEEKLWSTGVLDPSTPQGLLNCVFFLNGKNFCLRGGVEHRELKLSQFSREVLKVEGRHLVRYTYNEYVSKNRSGGLKQLKQGNKTVHQYESENVDRCHVIILDKYFSKLPEEAKRKDIFYLKPKVSTPKDPLTPWYTAVPIGKHTLQGMMKTMSKSANLEQTYTNHSLRATGVTQMFQASVPEKLIMERSGHRSIEGLRQYERTGILQELQVCNVLSKQEVPKARATTQATPNSIVPAVAQMPTFSGCTFQNCTFQMSQIPAQPPITCPTTEEFSNVDLSDFFDF